MEFLYVTILILAILTTMLLCITSGMAAMIYLEESGYDFPTEETASLGQNARRVFAMMWEARDVLLASVLAVVLTCVMLVLGVIVVF